MRFTEAVDTYVKALDRCIEAYRLGSEALPHSAERDIALLQLDAADVLLQSIIVDCSSGLEDDVLPRLWEAVMTLRGHIEKTRIGVTALTEPLDNGED